MSDKLQFVDYLETDSTLVFVSPFSILPLGEGLGKRLLNSVGELKALAPTLTQRERE
jgi:hypothetical protein